MGTPVEQTFPTDKQAIYDQARLYGLSVGPDRPAPDEPGKISCGEHVADVYLSAENGKLPFVATTIMPGETHSKNYNCSSPSSTQSLPDIAAKHGLALDTALQKSCPTLTTTVSAKAQESLANAGWRVSPHFIERGRTLVYFVDVGDPNKSIAVEALDQSHVQLNLQTCAGATSHYALDLAGGSLGPLP